MANNESFSIRGWHQGHRFCDLSPKISGSSVPWDVQPRWLFLGWLCSQLVAFPLHIIQLSGNWPLVVSQAACIYSHSSTSWPLDGCLQRFWPYCILLDQPGNPLKSPWMIVAFCRPKKQASFGGCQSRPPNCAVQPGSTWGLTSAD
jgi:hypothetical protein